MAYKPGKLIHELGILILSLFMLSVLSLPLTIAASRPTVQITSGNLTRNQSNIITATVTDPDSDAVMTSVYIYVKSPSTESTY
ncbi:MAG: hypothetical protein QW400_04430, partial [Candidatus Diapherotrites archaeon]